jgi:hypothetical protein
MQAELDRRPVGWLQVDSGRRHVSWMKADVWSRRLARRMSITRIWAGRRTPTGRRITTTCWGCPDWSSAVQEEMAVLPTPHDMVERLAALT